MALSGGLEAVENAVAATLRAYLIAELDAIWSAAGDVATVPKPYTVWGGTPHVEVGQVPLQTDPPSLQVYSRQGRNPDNVEPAWGKFDYPVIIEGLIGGDSLPYMDRVAKRFVYAIGKVLYKHPTLDDSLSGPAGVLIDAVDAGAPEVEVDANGEAGDFQQRPIVRVIVQLEETTSNY